MAHRTSGGCECRLDANAIKVKIGGKTVEVCCEECTQRLKEADAFANAVRRG